MKTLKDLLRQPEVPVTGQETTIHIETVRVRDVRADLGPMLPLEQSIRSDGLRHPITVWTDGTLVSGERRLRAHFHLANGADGDEKYRHIRAIFVDNVEDAGKRLLADGSDEDQAVPMKPSEIARLWDVLRKLDEPAAARRLDEARRQGVLLRKQTQNGMREPGRSSSRGKGSEYLLNIIGEPFGMSEATASRLYAIHRLAGSEKASDERRKAAAAALAELDRGESSIWRSYAALFSGRRPATSGPRVTAATEPAPAAKQRAAWDRAVPQLEGLVAGLTELGPPNPNLDWSVVGPVHARLMKIRRDLEKTITKMRETAQS